jgi:ubiquitin-activating enzyme E1
MSEPPEGGEAAEGEIDESLYSRQIFVLGKEAMLRMARAHVLISGLGGLGVEAAKNVCLAGVKTVTLHDTKPVTWYDLNAQFYCREAHLGKNRAESCVKLVAELNTYTPTTHNMDELTDDFIKKFRVVCLADNSFDEQVRVGKICRANKVEFIVCETKGLFGKVMSSSFV